MPILFTRNDTASIGLTVVQISPSQRAVNNHRTGISIVNTSTGGQNISLFFSDTQQAVSGSGQYLKPGQGIFDFDNAGYVAWQGNITAIADAAGGTVAIYEAVGSA